MKILHLEDQAPAATRVRELLRTEWPDCTVTLAAGKSEFVAALASETYDLILAEFALPDLPGFDALDLARTCTPDVPFIFFTAIPGEDRALHAVHRGAADYVLKHQLFRLPTAVRRALRESAESHSRRQAEAAHRRLLAIFDHTPDFVGMTTTDGRVLYLNASALALIGLPADADLSTKTIADFHPPAVADFLLREAVQEAMRDNTWTGETILLTHEGRQIPVSQVIIAHKNSDGSTGYLSTMMRDLSAQRRHEAAVHESSERFRLVARVTDDVIWDLNLLTSELWWSDAMETVYGHRRTGRDPSLAFWTSHLHPDDAERVEHSFREALARCDATWTAEYRFRRADGTYADILDRGHILRDATGRPSRMIGSLIDVTARKQADRRVRELIALLDRAPDAIVVSELDGRVTFWNRGAERLSGWSAPEALGRRLEELFGPEARLKIEAAHSTLETHGEWRADLHLTNRRGLPVPVEFNATVVRDEQGRPTARLNIITDVTDRKKIGARLHRTEQRETVALLAASLAHDLHRTVAPLQAALPALRTRLASSADHELIAAFETGAARGAALHRQILGFASARHGEFRPVQLKHLVRELGTVVRDTFPSNIRYEESTAPGLWPVHAHPAQLHQLLLILCTNAREAMPHGGTLRVSAESLLLDDLAARALDGARAGPWVILHIDDNGPGIPPENIERIWEPFFSTKPGGLGLGLATARGIVQLHHGFITVQSTPGHGANFRIFLPAAAHPAVPPGHDELLLVHAGEAEFPLFPSSCSPQLTPPR